MIDIIENFFASVFGNNVVLATILISIIPIIEVKGAIPFAMSSAIWKGFELNSGLALLWSLVGSSLIVPILLLIYEPIIRFLKNTKLFKKIAVKIEEKINRKKQAVENKINEEDKNKQANKKTILKALSVFVFVAIPLPFTGVWTGSCLAVALGLNFFLSCVVIIVGNAIAGIIVSIFSSVLTPLVYIIIFLSLMLIIATFYIIKNIRIKKQSKFANKDKVSGKQ